MSIRRNLSSISGFGLVFLTGLAPLAAQGAKPAAPPVSIAPVAPTAAELAGPPASAARLPSGVATRQLRAGDGTGSPRVQDVVVFRAVGRRKDGGVVQDTFAAKDPSKIVLSRLHKGWQEGMTAMSKGEQRRFWFPAAMMPKDPKTGVQEAIVFDVELLAFGRMPDTPASLTAPDPRAAKKGAGSSVLVVKKGRGGTPVARTDAAMLDFSLWNRDGQLVASTAMDGRPTLFPVEKVMPAFADCLLGMTVEEERQCWIPAMHNQGFPGALTGDLIFQVKLLSVMDFAKLTGSTAKPTKP
jgi:FKBP-type peptidyl-prolyl cis-trans isomerase